MGVLLKKIKVVVLFTVCVALALAPVAGASQPSQAAALAPELLPPPGVQLLASDGQGVLLELYTPDFTFDNAADCQQLSVPDMLSGATPGAPALPMRGVMLGIPLAVDVNLTVLHVESTPLPGHYNLCPTPTPILDFSLDGPPDYQGYATIRDADAYAHNAFMPATVVELVETGFIRSQRFAQLRFFPFQYNPVTGELRQLTQIRVRLDFNQPHQALAQQPRMGKVDEGVFEDTLRGVLLNYEQARDWRRPAPAIALPTANLLTTSAPTYKLHVNADGLYRVTRAMLEAAGANLSNVDPRTFRMTNQGQPVALYVMGEADGSFDAEDVILFYGEGLDTRYTDTNVYWLTWGGANGLRMGEVSGAPDGTGVRPEYHSVTLNVENNVFYQSKLPDIDGDHWYWDYVWYNGGAPISKQYTLELPAVTADAPPVTLRGSLVSYEAIPMHHTQILLNGVLLADETWSPNTEYRFTLDLSSAVLAQGPNTITVRAGVGDGIMHDVPFINWFALDYYAPYHVINDALTFQNERPGIWEYAVSGFTTQTITLLDITDPYAPQRITGAVLTTGASYTLTFQSDATGTRRYVALTATHYRAPATIVFDQRSIWRTSVNGADYIIISPGEFHSALQPLVARRAAQGLRVALVDVQDVYDEFADGIFTPIAIRDFVAYAYHYWRAPAPAFLLLVGDGHYDYRNYFNRGQANHIPPYLGFVDPWMGETAADNRYVTVSGDDILPDLHLGRLPARNISDVQIMISKILAYEDAPSSTWQVQHLFIADNADNAGNFPALSDLVANNYVPVPYQVQKVYLGVTHANATVARTAIRDAINAGRLIVNYVGHGSVQFWANEKLMDFGLLGTFTNTGKLPLFLPMNCYEGYYIIPNSPTHNFHSFGETVVRKSGGGAIASWSPTGLGVAVGHDYLHHSIYEAFFYEGIVQFGPATTYAKYYLYANTGSHRELLDTYLLFGDPALALKVLPADVALTHSLTPDGPLYPGTRVTYTLSYTNSGPATAFNVAINAALPERLLAPTVTYTGATITPRPGTRYIWDVADLPAGSGGKITITAQIDPQWPWPLTYSATITTTGVETDTANNTPPPIVTDSLVPELALALQGTTWTRAGEPVTYTLAFENRGVAAATGVTLTYLLPTQLLSPTVTFTGATITARTGFTYTWDVADLPPGGGGVVTVTAIVSPDFYRGILLSQAMLKGQQPERNTANNSAQLLTGVYIPDLWLSVSGLEAVPWGGEAIYTLRYGNAGNDIATSVVLTTVYPTALLSPTVAWAGIEPVLLPGSNLAWALGDLIPNASGILTLTGRLPDMHTAPLTLTAIISTTDVERQLDDNAVGPLMTHILLPDMQVELLGPSGVEIGAQHSYTLRYHNVGTALARQVLLTTSIPSELQSLAVSWDGVAPPLVSVSPWVWDLGNVPPGSSGQVMITGQLPPAHTGVLIHPAAISTTAPEIIVVNNAVTLTTRILQPDLVVEKTGPVEVRPGEPITYVITYRNVGEAHAHNVVLNDTLVAPGGQRAQVTQLSRHAAATSGGSWVWQLGTFAPGAEGHITITLRFAGVLEGSVTNEVTLSTTTLETNPTNNHAQVFTIIVPYRLYLPLMLR